MSETELIERGYKVKTTLDLLDERILSKYKLLEEEYLNEYKKEVELKMIETSIDLLYKELAAHFGVEAL